MKRIIICADGTWNRPETADGKEQPTNVLKFARGLSPKGFDGVSKLFFTIGELVLTMTKLGEVLLARAWKKT